MTLVEINEKEPKYYFCEKFIEGYDDGYQNRDSDVASALSHFSWQISRGSLMITNLKGVSTLLTNSTLLSVD